MRRFLTVLSFLIIPVAARAEGPRALLTRAIAAHGGQQRLAQARADRSLWRGTYHTGTDAVPFTNELTVQLPGQYKSVLRLSPGPVTVTVVLVLNGEQARFAINDKPQPMDGPTLAQLRQTLELESAMRLVPLLSDPAVALEPLGEATIEDRVVVGVGVQGRGQRGLKLYFDKKTALLMASECQLDGPKGKVVVQQVRYSRHRAIGGYVQPHKMTVYTDGKKVMEGELIGARRAERIDPAEFRIP